MPYLVKLHYYTDQINCFTEVTKSFEYFTGMLDWIKHNLWEMGFRRHMPVNYSIVRID